MYCAPVQGVPALADLTSRCSISPVYYETFGVEFQRRDRLVDFFDSIDRRDPTLSARFADCGLTGDNMASVAAFLNALALIGLRSAPGAVDTAEMRTTTLAAVFAAFLMNGTTAADPDAFTEKYTGAGRIADLKRWRRYRGAETVPWPVPLSVRGQRDFQADTFRNPFNLQLNLFTPITRRLETWRADDQAVDLAGLSLIRFRPRPETWASATDWVGNARWAMYGPSGVVGLDPGATGVPIYVSQAHFLDADPVLSASLTGLQPDRAQHQSFVDFEPNLGAALRARLRFQVNLRLDRGMVADPLLVRAEHAYLPLWWMEVGGDGPDPDAARRLRTGLAGAVQLCFIVRLLLSMAALPLFCYGVGLARASITAWRKA